MSANIKNKKHNIKCFDLIRKAPVPYIITTAIHL